MSAFLRDVSARVPLVLMLDDLHWADRATLLMLSHLARELAHARICVVGTYRDTDLDRTHPLSQTLAEFNREQLFSRIALRGLSRDDVASYIAAVAHLEPSSALVSRIYEETEGNPFFLSEIVNLLAQEGTLSRASESSIGGLSIPEGVKEALGRRLDKLSPDANALLQLAAIAGREFDQALLVALSGRSDDEVLELLEESLSGRVIEETGIFGEYRFTHALMQETLAAELSSARQVRMHGQIADALEAMDTGTTTNPAELAFHYTESAVMSTTHAQKAAHYSHLAAESAAAQLAFDEAARHYRNCLALVQTAPDRLGQDEVDLLLGLALAEAASSQVRFWEPFEQAVEIAEHDSDPLRGARPWLAIGHTSFPHYFFADRLPMLERALSAVGEGDSIEHCMLLALRAFAFPDSRGDADATTAKEMAARLRVDVAERWLRQRALAAAAERGDFEALYEMAGAFYAEFAAMPGADAQALLMLQLRLLAVLLLGDLGRATDAAEAQLVAAREHRRPLFEWTPLTALASAAFSRGELTADDPTLADTNGYARMLQVEVALARADFASVLRMLSSEIPDPRLAELHGWVGLRARALLSAGDEPGARRAFEAWAASWRAERFGIVFEHSTAIANLDDAVFVFEDRELRVELYEYLERYPTLRNPVLPGANPDYLRGRFALDLGHVDEAEAHFRTGLEWATRPNVRFLIDAGRNHQGLAEVAERRGELEVAHEHLDAAAELFARHGAAKLYLDQVLSKKEILKA
jgi:tetratricopeptide (TPR) repeat protein